MSKSRISCEDLINLEKPKMPMISPLGEKVAYVVEKSNIENNSVTDHFYIYDKATNKTVAIITMDKIIRTAWSGDVCFLLGKDQGIYKLVRVINETIEVLVSTDQQLSTFTTSSDGQQIYFSRLTKTPADIVKKHKEEGYVYRWGKDNGGTIALNQYQHHQFEEIWCLDIKTNEQTFLTKFSWNNWVEWEPDLKPLIETMSLSTNRSYLAVSLNRLGKPELGEAGFQFDLCVINIEQNTIDKLLDDHLAAKMTPCWLNDNELVFQEANYNQEINEYYNLWIWNALTKQYQQLRFFSNDKIIKSIFFDSQAQHLYVESTNRLCQLSLITQKVEEFALPSEYFNSAWLEPSFTIDQSFKWLATVIEDREQPPQVILYDVSNKISNVISDLNKNICDISLGKIEPVSFELASIEKKKVTAQGYLVHPVDEIQGKRYPLIVASYGFSGKTCAANAEEWHSTLPAQVFAAEGYFVLLLNRPGSGAQTNITDSKQAREDEGYNMLRIFELAVMILIDRGCIDAEKVGIYGWSHGAFIVEFLIAHSTTFKVASLGEGGDYNPAMAWGSGNKMGIELCNNVFGGPPWGSCLNNYVEFSPFFQIDKIKAPLLMEFSGGAVFALEMYTPLRYLNVPAELVLYDGEPHIFVKPKARLASMKRKLDWFNFWFFDKRDSEKPDQYVRWVEMREIT